MNKKVVKKKVPKATEPVIGGPVFGYRSGTSEHTLATLLPFCFSFPLRNRFISHAGIVQESQATLAFLWADCEQLA